MAKSPTAKTNRHTVPALKTPAAKPAVKAAPKPAVKTVPKPAVKAAAQPAVKAAPKAAPKAAAAAAPKAEVKAAPKPAPKGAPKAAPQAVETAPEAVREKVRKTKLVRDSFTMPEQEYAVLSQVKKACLKAGFEIKKSELLRIGVALIRQLDMATLQQVLASLPQLKTGRPKND